MKTVKCPECLSEDIYKNGLSKGKQRYKCKECNKQFIERKEYFKVCPICGKLLVTDQYNRKYHPGKCQEIAYKRNRETWVNENRDRVYEKNRKYQKNHYIPTVKRHPNLKKQIRADSLRRYYFRERGICDGAVDFIMIKLQMPLKELYDYMFPLLNDKQVFCAITGMSRDRYLELKEFMGIKT